MPVTIDEVSADVAPQTRGPAAAPPAEPQTPTPAQLRQLREQMERLQQRALRLEAN